jgi:hypothetical protein
VWEILLLQKPANNILSLEVEVGVRRTAGDLLALEHPLLRFQKDLPN